MNIEPLFKRFDELADAPERIPALRKVILAYLLHSAVNSPNAISRAATLREAHDIRRRELIKNVIRKEVPTVPEVTDEDLPPILSDIPTALFDRLGNIATIEKGLSQIQRTTPGKYPLVVTAETRSSSESFDFEGAAAIVPLVSSTGHGDASLKRLHYQEGRYAVGNILAVVKPIYPALLRARFIYEYLSAFKEELLVSRMVGTANVSLTVNKLKEVPVPLVSGPVLGRIDELMGLCDRLEVQQAERETRHAALARASLARFADAPTPSNLNYLFHKSYTIPPADLRKSILTLAVQGKLVPQDPNDEPACKQLERIAAQKSKNGRVTRVKAVKAGSAAPEEAETNIPDGWEKATLADLVTVLNGRAYSKDELLDAGTPVLRVGNLFTSKHWYYSNLELEPDKYCDKGDLIFAWSASFGPFIWPGPKVIYHYHIWKLALHCEADLHKGYLYWFLQEKTQEIKQAGHGVSMLHMTKEKMEKLEVMLPPLAEQRRIVAQVEQLMALVDALETQLAASRASGAKLLEAVVCELTGKQ